MVKAKKGLLKSVNGEKQQRNGLVTSRTMTCVARQNSGVSNHLRCFEMQGVTSSNAMY